MTETTTHNSESLNPVEVDRLAELEHVVERGMQTFVEVGTALGEIRDRRLYRASHDTFERYCRERWGFVASRARQLIAAAETVTAVTLDGHPPPANEAVVRELVPLRRDSERLRGAWTGAVAEHGPRPTAAQVRERVNRRSPTIAAEQMSRDEADARIADAEQRRREERSVLRCLAIMTGSATGAVERLRAYGLDTADLAQLKMAAANVKRTRAALREIATALADAISEARLDSSESDR